MWMIIFTVLILILLLFVMIECAKAATAIKQANYDSAYNDTKIVAITTGILTLITIIALIYSIYSKVRG